MKIAIYPGSFDPITNGHIDILKRALEVFDEVVVLVAINPDKKSHFTMEERKEMIKEAIKDIKGASVDTTTGLTVDFAEKVGSTHLVRGIRSNKDNEYEFRMRDINKELNKNIDTMFFSAKDEFANVSSTRINEMYKNGEDISKLVPASVLKFYK